MTRGAFITGTGTGTGKTFVSRALARACSRRGDRTAAIKPIETGVDPLPQDALALARACSTPQLAQAPDFYRAQPPLSPYAAQLEGHPAPNISRIVDRVRRIGAECEWLWVEGAGGLLVPLDAHNTMADLALSLRLPLLLVAPNELGVLSHALSCIESAQRRALPVLATVLVESSPQLDASTRTNREILAERCSHPVLVFPACIDDDDALADAATACGLVALVDSYRFDP